MTILVTGSSGQLGRPTVTALRGYGAQVRGLTRAGTDGAVAADLISGQGLDAAFDGVHTVVHLATSSGKRDIPMARNLITAAKRAGIPHLVLISIVGVQGIPLGFYRDRFAIENIARDSGVPHTIQRATQFHSLIDWMFAVQKLPVVMVPSWRFQPIAVAEVANKLAQLALGEPQGAVPDIGGPHQHTMLDLYRMWQRATGTRRPAWSFHLPGKLFAAYDAGMNLVSGEPYGQQSFESYLSTTYQ